MGIDIDMALRKLKKRKYLGEGYVSLMKNIETGELKYVPITKERYEHVGLRLPEELDMPGWVRIHSEGGTFKVDTPNTLMGLDEFIEIGDDVHMMLSGTEEMEEYQKVKKVDLEQTIDDTVFEIDEKKLKLKAK